MASTQVVQLASGRPAGVPTIDELMEGVPTGYSAAVLAFVDDKTPLYATQKEKKKNLMMTQGDQSENVIEMTKDGCVSVELHSKDENQPCKVVINTGDQMVHAEGKNIKLRIGDDSYSKKFWAFFGYK